MESGAEKKINCYQCVHFAVTWNPKFPRCCKLFGFKTTQMPSLAVFKSSGEPCGGFKQKPQLRKVKRKGWEA